MIINGIWWEAIFNNILSSRETGSQRIFMDHRRIVNSPKTTAWEKTVKLAKEQICRQEGCTPVPLYLEQSFSQKAHLWARIYSSTAVLLLWEHSHETLQGLATLAAYGLDISV